MPSKRGFFSCFSLMCSQLFSTSFAEKEAVFVQIDSQFSKRPDYYLFHVPKKVHSMEINGRIMKRLEPTLKIPSNVSAFKLIYRQ